MYIIVGLGNPGLKYKKTPHNAGFMALDVLAKSLGTRFKKSKFEAQIAQASIGGQNVVLLKPQTFMNKSGKSVLQAVHFFRAQPAELIVIYVDKDLAPGKLRIRGEGSAGSHNGMRSIIEDLKTEEFLRIRCGIGAQSEGMRLMDHVLHKLSREELSIYAKMAEDAANAAKEIVQNGLEAAQQKYSSKK